MRAICSGFARRAFTAAFSTLCVSSLAVAQPTVSAAALKAAFVFNFATFAEWPAESARTGPLTICVVGDEAVADQLETTVKGRAIDGRELAVSRAKSNALRGCHVLYVSGLTPAESQRIVDDLRTAPVLTVSDRDRFAQSGGIVGLFVEDGRMRFAINVEAAARSGLRISSRLLSLAKVVKDEPVRP